MDSRAPINLATLAAVFGDPGRFGGLDFVGGPSGHPWPRRLRRQHYRKWPPKRSGLDRAGWHHSSWHLHHVEDECRFFIEQYADGSVRLASVREGRHSELRRPLNKALAWFRNSKPINVDPHRALADRRWARWSLWQAAGRTGARR